MRKSCGETMAAISSRAFASRVLSEKDKADVGLFSHS